MLAVDVSVYGGLVPKAQWKRLKKNAEVGLAIVGSWHGTRGNPYAHDNLRAAREAGLATATYIALSPTLGGAAQVEAGQRQAGDEWPELRFVAIDVEVEGLTIQQIADAVEMVRHLGQRPVIYTAAWFWRGHLGDPHDFSHIPLWNAYYDGAPDLDFPANPYGGWSPNLLVGEQYQGTTDLLGVSVDLNSFKDEFVMRPDAAPDWEKIELQGRRDIGEAVARAQVRLAELALLVQQGQRQEAAAKLAEAEQGLGAIGGAMDFWHWSA